MMLEDSITLKCTEEIRRVLEKIQSALSIVAIDDPGILQDRERRLLSSGVDCIHETLISLGDRME